MPQSETFAAYSDFSRRDRAIGALLGLAVGDAVGTTLEFASRNGHSPLTDMIGGGRFRLARGQWTDDTSMALCLAESLLANSSLDPLDLVQRFCRWPDHAENSCTGRCFDIGGTVGAALSRFEQNGDPLAGSTDPNTAGNGSLMRLSPVAIFWHAESQLADQAAAEQSRTTHAAPAAVDACRVFARLLVRAIAGERKFRLLMPWPDTAGLDPAVAAVMAGSWRTKSRDEIQSTGYVVHSLEAALWAVDHAEGFESAVLTAANLGGDADTVAAITGQLAGTLWGCSGIPEKCRTYLAWSTKIRDVAAALYAAGSRAVRTAPISPHRTLFDRLCDEARLNVVRACLFDQPPPAHPMPARRIACAACCLVSPSAMRSATHRSRCCRASASNATARSGIICPTTMRRDGESACPLMTPSSRSGHSKFCSRKGGSTSTSLRVGSASGGFSASASP